MHYVTSFQIDWMTSSVKNWLAQEWNKSFETEKRPLTLDVEKPKTNLIVKFP